MKRHSGNSAGLPSQRQLRVGELVRHALAEILTRGEVVDPVIEIHVITVAEVRMSPDLKHATCFVEPLGGGDAETVVASLEKHKKYLRGQISRRVDLKFSPELHFRLDTRFDDDARIDDLLRSDIVSRDLAHDEDGEA